MAAGPLSAAGCGADANMGCRMSAGSRARDFGAAVGEWRSAARPLVSSPLSGQMGSTVMTRIAYAVRRKNQEARPLPTGTVHMERMHCKRTRMGSSLGVTFTRDSLRNLSFYLHFTLTARVLPQGIYVVTKN